jgi:hypothetical protein
MPEGQVTFSLFTPSIEQAAVVQLHAAGLDDVEVDVRGRVPGEAHLDVPGADLLGAEDEVEELSHRAEQVDQQDFDAEALARRGCEVGLELQLGEDGVAGNEGRSLVVAVGSLELQEHPVHELRAARVQQPEPKLGRAARDQRAGGVDARDVGLLGIAGGRGQLARDEDAAHQRERRKRRRHRLHGERSDVDFRPRRSRPSASARGRLPPRRSRRSRRSPARSG